MEYYQLEGAFCIMIIILIILSGCLINKVIDLDLTKGQLKLTQRLLKEQKELREAIDSKYTEEYHKRVALQTIINDASQATKDELVSIEVKQQQIKKEQEAKEKLGIN